MKLIIIISIIILLICVDTTLQKSEVKYRHMKQMAEDESFSRAWERGGKRGV